MYVRSTVTLSSRLVAKNSNTMLSLEENKRLKDATETPSPLSSSLSSSSPPSSWYYLYPESNPTPYSVLSYHFPPSIPGRRRAANIHISKTRLCYTILLWEIGTSVHIKDSDMKHYSFWGLNLSSVCARSARYVVMRPLEECLSVGNRSFELSHRTSFICISRESSNIETKSVSNYGICRKFE